MLTRRCYPLLKTYTVKACRTRYYSLSLWRTLAKTRGTKILQILQVPGRQLFPTLREGTTSNHWLLLIRSRVYRGSSFRGRGTSRVQTDTPEQKFWRLYPRRVRPHTDNLSVLSYSQGSEREEGASRLSVHSQTRGMNAWMTAEDFVLLCDGDGKR